MFMFIVGSVTDILCFFSDGVGSVGGGFCCFVFRSIIPIFFYMSVCYFNGH